jgi:hypothetical protein
MIDHGHLDRDSFRTSQNPFKSHDIARVEQKNFDSIEKI